MGLVMPAAQFWVTGEAGNYLCMARALMFEGSILVYNPTQNEAEWVPVQGLSNDLTPGEERSALGLANYGLVHAPGCQGGGPNCQARGQLNCKLVWRFFPNRRRRGRGADHRYREG